MDTFDNSTDNQLINDYLKGHDQALEALVKKYLRLVYNFAYRFLNNVQDAEDVAQETWLKAWKNLKRFNQQRNFKTWLFTIAKNSAFDHLKKKKSIPWSVFINDDEEDVILNTLADPAPLPDELFYRKDLSALLTKAIDKLAPQYRIVLFLHHNDHLTFNEIAESLNQPLNTVKSRYRRGLIMLREFLWP